MADTMSVSESERDRTVKALTKHCGEGRITLDELEQRIELAFAAQTTAELHELVRDLPSDLQLLGVERVPPSPALQPRPSPSTLPFPNPLLSPQARKAGEIALRVHTTVFVAVMSLLIAIYVLTNFGGHPWPIWVALPWGAALGIHAGVHKAVWASSD